MSGPHGREETQPVFLSLDALLQPHPCARSPALSPPPKDIIIISFTGYHIYICISLKEKEEKENPPKKVQEPSECMCACVYA